MVYLYTCAACQRGEHEKCERGHPAPPGVIGGSSCICVCRGRSWDQVQKDTDEALRKKAEDAIRLNERQKNLQLDIGPRRKR